MTLDEGLARAREIIERHADDVNRRTETRLLLQECDVDDIDGLLDATRAVQRAAIETQLEAMRVDVVAWLAEA